MKCRDVRDQLTARPAAPAPGPLADHLAGCPACSRYAARLGLAREILRHHHAGVEPDGAFAARVMVRLPRPAEMLGWAALRLMPAALALVVVLGWLCFARAPSPPALFVEAPTDDPLAWIAQPPEPGP